MDITALSGKWRREAADQPTRRHPAERSDIKHTLQRVADELELAWHQYAHDAAFESGCRFCDWEREHNDNYPEGELRS